MHKMQRLVTGIPFGKCLFFLLSGAISLRMTYGIEILWLLSAQRLSIVVCNNPNWFCANAELFLLAFHDKMIADSPR